MELKDRRTWIKYWQTLIHFFLLIQSTNIYYVPTTPGTVLSDEDLEIYYALNMVAQKVYMLQVR